MKVQNKVVVVTGGGNGIGRELVLHLLARGASVAAVDINESALQETVELAGNNKYSRAIRQEYFWVPELIYRRERSKILKSFIAREVIYFTGEMKKRFEEQARKNINGEINSLGFQ